MADIIEFPRVSARHGLSREDIGELQKRVELMPGHWVIDPSHNRDRSRLWLRFSDAQAGSYPVFGFARRHGLVHVTARCLDSDRLDHELEASFASVEAAILVLVGAVHAVQAEDHPSVQAASVSVRGWQRGRGPLIPAPS